MDDSITESATGTTRSFAVCFRSLANTADFNDLASEEPRLVTQQVEEVPQGLREKSQVRNTGNRIGGGLTKNQWQTSVYVYSPRVDGTKGTIVADEIGVHEMELPLINRIHSVST